MVEHQLVLENLLGKFHPLVAFVVADERGGFSHPLLREVGTAAAMDMLLWALTMSRIIYLIIHYRLPESFCTDTLSLTLEYPRFF